MKKVLGLILLLAVPLELQAARGIRTVLVFPFENQSSRTDLNWISESFAEVLASRLTGPNRFVLGRDDRDSACAQMSIPPGTPLTLASEYKLAENLGVDWAVVGNFNVEGDRLSARARLLDVHQLKLATPLDVTGDLTDLVDLQNRLAWRLLATHDPDFTVGREEDFSRRFPEIRLDAFENYIRGILAADNESRVRFLTESDRLNPADHRAAFELGRFYFGEKDYANSVKWLRKLSESDSNFPESLFLVGVDEYILGHQDASEKAFTTLAQQTPLNEVSNNLGVLKSRRERFAEALTYFQRAHQADLTDADFAYNLGVCYWRLNRYDDSAKALKEAIQLNDDDSDAHTLLAVVSRKLGDSERERSELAWLAEHEGGMGDGVTGDILPQTRLKKKYDGRAFGMLSVAVNNALEASLAGAPPAEHAGVHLARGEKLLAEGRWPEAERDLAEAVTFQPENYDAHVLLAQAFEGEGRHRDAAAELQVALKLKNTSAAHLWLARVDLSLHQQEGARNEAQAALELDPGNQEAQALLKQVPNPAPVKRKKP